MRMRTHKRAFTLIEILIVVVILGILAAIVIPQFTDASEEAMEASLRSQLQTLRSQIELYRVKNGGTLPDLLGQGWDQLVDDDYIQQAPVNPFQNSSTIAAAAAMGEGWVWEAVSENLYGVAADGTQFVE